MSDTTTSPVTSDANGVELENSASKETAKTLMIAATTVAVVVFVPKAIHFARDKFTEIRTTRAMKAMDEKVHVVTDLPEKTGTEN